MTERVYGTAQTLGGHSGVHGKTLHFAARLRFFVTKILEEKPPIKMGGKGVQLREGTVTLHTFRGISFPHLCLGHLTGDVSAGTASVSVPLSTPVVSLGAPHR